ncbi:hypothetical protein E2C01_031721 [Portunus trituberculatus]|uniref:Uncharacterized protein n=1 Tax=Portunus trituberculatus TaxID=210409 RepID=A0A5B7EYK4_PORTR|nr:hypothetical protein [Portunus trituberculatus]
MGRWRKPSETLDRVGNKSASIPRPSIWHGPGHASGDSVTSIIGRITAMAHGTQDCRVCDELCIIGGPDSKGGCRHHCLTEAALGQAWRHSAAPGGQGLLAPTGWGRTTLAGRLKGGGTQGTGTVVGGWCAAAGAGPGDAQRDRAGGRRHSSVCRGAPPAPGVPHSAVSLWRAVVAATWPGPVRAEAPHRNAATSREGLASWIFRSRI